MRGPKLDYQDRIFWITMLRLLDTWREVLQIVQPDTVTRWQRRGYRHDLRLMSKPKSIGRSTIGWALTHLLKRHSRGRAGHAVVARPAN